MVCHKQVTGHCQGAIVDEGITHFNYSIYYVIISSTQVATLKIQVDLYLSLIKYERYEETTCKVAVSIFARIEYDKGEDYPISPEMKVRKS